MSPFSPEGEPRRGWFKAERRPADVSSMTQAIGSGASGLAAQFRRFSQSAARVATPEPAPDLVAETVEQIASRQMAAANVAVIRTADQMTGELINIWA
jgi:hypothetical protein